MSHPPSLLRAKSRYEAQATVMVAAGRPALMACEHCDTLFAEPQLSDSEIGRCPRCETVLCRGRTLSANSIFALAITAAIAFVLANAFPVIGVRLSGLDNEATIAEAALALANGYSLPIALVMLVSMILVPAVQIALIVWISFFGRYGKRAPGFSLALRTLENLRPWSMVEVFLMGALVAIVKLSGYLDVRAEIGIGALFALTFLIALLAGRRTREWWHLGETRLEEIAQIEPVIS